MNPAQQIRQSWEANAKNWIATLDNGEIESRRLVTNKAIVEAVQQHSPQKVLDLGCGEGWLSRALRDAGIEAWGADATRELINEAAERDGEFYFCLSYEDIVSGRSQLPVPFDLVVINFALLDKTATDELIAYLPKLLKPKGSVVIQTLHPLAIDATEAYVWDPLESTCRHASLSIL